MLGKCQDFLRIFNKTAFLQFLLEWMVYYALKKSFTLFSSRNERWSTMVIRVQICRNCCAVFSRTVRKCSVAELKLRLKFRTCQNRNDYTGRPASKIRLVLNMVGIAQLQILMRSSWKSFWFTMLPSALPKLSAKNWVNYQSIFHSYIGLKNSALIVLQKNFICRYMGICYTRHVP